MSRRGLHEKTAILAGIEPLGEAELEPGTRLRVRAKGRPSHRIPDAVLQQVASKADPAARHHTAIDVAVETVKQLRGTKGLRGFSIDVNGDPDAALEIISRPPRVRRSGDQLAVPAKYVTHGKPVAPRFRTVGKLGIVDWREDCSSCHNCVKRGCIYGFYRDEADTLRDEIGYLDYIYQCKGCLNCVQDCTKNILTRVVNPEYNRLGDSYFTPEIVLSTWFQPLPPGRERGVPLEGDGVRAVQLGVLTGSTWCAKRLGVR